MDDRYECFYKYFTGLCIHGKLNMIKAAPIIQSLTCMHYNTLAIFLFTRFTVCGSYSEYLVELIINKHA